MQRPVTDVIRKHRILPLLLFVQLLLFFLAMPSTPAATAEDPVEVRQEITDYVAGSSEDLTAAEIASYANRLGAAATPTYGAAATIDSWRLSTSCVALSPTTFVVAYRDELGSGFGKAIIGAVSGREITWGAEQVFNNASTRQSSIAVLSTTRFVVTYKDQSTNHGMAIVGDVTPADNSITFHTPAVPFNSASTDRISAAGLSSTRFIVAFLDVGNSNQGTAIAGDVATGGSITFDPLKESVFNGLSYGISAAPLSSTKFVVAYRDNVDGFGKAGIGDVQVPDNTITFGPETVFNPAVVSADYVSAATLSSTMFIIAYEDEADSNHGNAVVGNVSGNTIAFGSEATFNTGETKYISAAPLSSTKFVVAYEDVPNSQYGTSIVGEVSGNTVAFGPEVLFSQSTSDGNISCAMLTTGKFVVAWSDIGDSFRCKARVGAIDAPTVTTVAASPICTGSATLNGNITSVGGEECDSRGFQYRRQGSGPWTPVIESSGPYGTGAFSHPVTGLAPQTNYEFAAFASNTGGTTTGNTLTFTTAAVSHDSTWYLAEGTTAWGFSTYISIQNPNTGAVSAKVTLMPKGAANVTETINLPANSQTTLTNDHLVGKLGQKDFSTKVEAADHTKTIAVDRTMEWGGGAGAGRGVPGISSGKGTGPEGHSSVGVTSPAETWYLPEGSTNWGFETWLLIQNPNTAEASCDVTYMIEGEAAKTVNHKVPANSRESFSMLADVGNKDASIKVVSDTPVIPERAMYRYDRREGHDSIGTTTPAVDYYLAEGAVGYDSGYTTYVLVQNPQNSTNNVTITYLTGSGQVPGPSFTMEPNSRKTVKVNDTLPPNTDVSTSVHGSKPIIAERAMYWNSPAGEACHDSIGMSTPAMTFYLPDGQTSEGRETWTLVQNPNGTSVTVKVTYLPAGGGTPISFTEEIPKNSRKTYNMADKLPSGRASVLVQSLDGARPIMCERAMYWSSRSAGTDTIGGSSE